MKEAVLILGATSSIARASACELAARGYPLFLAARDSEELQRIAADIRIRFGVEVQSGFFDAGAFDSHKAFMESVLKQTGGLSGLLVAFGYLGSHQLALQDFDETHRIIDWNYTGACSVLTHFANYFSRKKEGFIIVISSVAGDRGRSANYIYGSSKAGLTSFLQGLRARLHPSGVRVITVKPGYVDTAMIYGRPNVFLAADPDDVGRRIVKALDGWRDVVYLPRFWRCLMRIVQMIPESLFKRLKI